MKENPEHISNKRKLKKNVDPKLNNVNSKSKCCLGTNGAAPSLEDGFSE